MKRGQVFVVEDDSALRSTLAELLSSAGYQVLTWPEAKSFLAEMPKVAPAVLLTDMRMPEISGLELHTALQMQGKQIPVIYISGESNLQEGIDAMKLGAIDFLIKPFSRESLLAAIEKGLNLDVMQRSTAKQEEHLQAVITRLAPREREVYRLMLKGYGNKEIMEALDISLATTKQYKSEVLRKLDVRSLSQLMKLSEGTGQDLSGTQSSIR